MAESEIHGGHPAVLSAGEDKWSEDRDETEDQHEGGDHALAEGPSAAHALELVWDKDDHKEGCPVKIENNHLTTSVDPFSDNERFMYIFHFNKPCPFMSRGRNDRPP